MKKTIENRYEHQAIRKTYLTMIYSRYLKCQNVYIRFDSSTEVRVPLWFHWNKYGNNWYWQIDVWN